MPVAELETMIADHPGVRQTAVVGYPDERLGERVAAVVVPVDGAAPDLRSLCEFLLERGLTTHYLPERLLLLDALPVTQSGKVQKFALRELVSTVRP